MATIKKRHTGDEAAHRYIIEGARARVQVELWDRSLLSYESTNKPSISVFALSWSYPPNTPFRTAGSRVYYGTELRKAWAKACAAAGAEADVPDALAPFLTASR